MLSIAKASALAPPWRRPGCLLCSLAAATALAGTAAANPGNSVTSRTTYHVILLTSRPLASTPVLNNRGQAAYTELTGGGLTRVRFFDGHRTRDIGTLGGPSAIVTAINDRGQLAGYSTVNATDLAVVHAFRWSRFSGILDIGKKVGGTSHGNAINDKGQVAGSAVFNPAVHLDHASFWSPQTGMIDIGAFGPSSVADALNDTGTVVGTSEGPAGGGPRSLVAFRWTQREGIRDIGTLPSEFTTANDVNNAGYIVGGTPFMPDAQPHAYVWRPRAGLLDLGKGTGERSGATKINEQGTVVGFTVTFGVLAHGFIWNRDMGFFELGAGSPRLATSANDVNNRNEVVGSLGNRAYVWTRAHGFADLSTRLLGAPKGLRLTSASAIGDDGTILAATQQGAYYLLVPEHGHERVSDAAAPDAAMQ